MERCQGKLKCKILLKTIEKLTDKLENSINIKW